MDEAFRTLAQYMKSFVANKRAEIDSEIWSTEVNKGTDLFTCLVRANKQEEKLGLSDDELVSSFGQATSWPN